MLGIFAKTIQDLGIFIEDNINSISPNNEIKDIWWKIRSHLSFLSSLTINQQNDSSKNLIEKIYSKIPLLKEYYDNNNLSNSIYLKIIDELENIILNYDKIMDKCNQRMSIEKLEELIQKCNEKTEKFNQIESDLL